MALLSLKPVSLKWIRHLAGQKWIPQRHSDIRIFFDNVAGKSSVVQSSYNYCVARYISSRMSNVVPVYLQAEKYKNRVAVVSQHGKYTYNDLLCYSLNLSKVLNDTARNKSTCKTHTGRRLAGERVCFLCDNDQSFIVTQWAIWMNGAIAVPLSKFCPTSELEYFASDSKASLLVVTDKLKDLLSPVSQNLHIPLKVLTLDEYSGEYNGASLSQSDDVRMTSENTFPDTKAMIIYTSGTTGKPKGVVHTLKNLESMMTGMISAWGWTDADVILHVLPLHHMHGIVNVLMTSLFCGATCVMLPKFEPKNTWLALLNHDPTITLFMAVPTIYAKLIEEYEHQAASDKPYLPVNLKPILLQRIRLMVSGSAALPEPIMSKWEELTGHVLLERYGMTEIGMALTNPLHGKRIPGAVGLPLPGVHVGIIDNSRADSELGVHAYGDEDSVTFLKDTDGYSGELLVKGDNVFCEYWNKPDATKEAFNKDGWFVTGDTALSKDGVFKIMGRTSVDIIKSGGYKISALDVERHLLEHPAIKDVAVIGLPDMVWGQLVAAVVVTNPGQRLEFNELVDWGKRNMAPYHIPKVIKCLTEMPRNLLGKVNKKQLAKSEFPDYF